MMLGKGGLGTRSRSTSYTSRDSMGHQSGIGARTINSSNVTSVTGGVIDPRNLLSDLLFMDARNHDWRIANGEYVLGEDLKLQMLECRINNVLGQLQEKLGIRAKETSFGLDQHNRIKDKRLFSLVEDLVKERLDDEALALVPSSWRLRERMKTVSVALVICLNIGTDPPDVVKTDPCARLECWVDPNAYPAQRALELVARNLQSQFELWQPRARYKYILDPYVEQVKKLCTSLRRNAKEERVLFHFNGHGVPRPTSNGEIWVFNVDYTQYIPLSVYDLKTWVGTPAIYTFDCSGAGLLLDHFIRDLEEDDGNGMDSQGNASAGGGSSTSQSDIGNRQRRAAFSKKSSDSSDCIVLVACGANEILPSSPDFPADIFTSCLTTPIKIALRWFVMCNRTPMEALGITVDMVDLVPGKLGDRKTPLGELNWIFTAITDTIAWTVLPRHLFRKLFRQDILVASLFRNFLLAERLLKSVNCNPQSYPPLPPTWQHHLWQAWDMAVENCLTQLPDLLPSKYTSTAGVAGGHHYSSAAAAASAAAAVSSSSATGPGSTNPTHNAPPNNITINGKMPGGGIDGTGPGSTSGSGVAGTGIGNPSGSGVTGSGGNPGPPKSPKSGGHNDGGNNDGNEDKKTDTTYVYRQSEFFANQLTAFQVWLSYGENVEKRCVPEQLPIVLQVLLSSFHRQRALDLLARFLNLGSWAVSLALSVGIFPYVNKLLLSPDEKIRPVLIHIWSTLLALDTSCQSDLVKEMNTMYQGQQGRGVRGLNEGGHHYFINQIRWLQIPQVMDLDVLAQEQLAESILHSVRAVFVLSVIVNGHPAGQQLCLQNGLIQVVKPFLTVRCEKAYVRKLRVSICRFKQWICYLLYKLCERNPASRRKAYEEDVTEILFKLLDEESSDVVQAAVFALGALIGPHHDVKAKSTTGGARSAQQAVSHQQQQQQLYMQQRTGRGKSHQSHMMMMSQMQQHDEQRKNWESEKIALRNDCKIGKRLVELISKGSPAIRRELVFALARLVVDPRHASLVQLTALELDEIQQKAGETNDSIYGSLMGKLNRKIGDNAESYLSIWLTLKRMEAVDPFPGVARIASTVATFVRDGALQRIEAIRSRAGLKEAEQPIKDSTSSSGIGATSAVPPAPNAASIGSASSTATTATAATITTSSTFTRSGSNISTKTSPVNNQQQQQQQQAAAAAAAAGGGGGGPNAGKRMMKMVGEGQQQQQEGAQDCDDILESMGLVSTLYVRRSNDFSQPTPLCNHDSWIPLDPDCVDLDPLGVDGQRILTWKRRLVDAAKAARVLKLKGSIFCGVYKDTGSGDENSLSPGSPRLGASGGMILETVDHSLVPLEAMTNRSVPGSPMQQFFLNQSHHHHVNNVNGSPNGGPSTLFVPSPKKRVQKRLDKLMKSKDIAKRRAEESTMILTMQRAGILNEKGPGKMEEHILFDHGQDMCNSLLFHPVEDAVIMAGHDDTIMVWEYTPVHIRNAGNVTKTLTSDALLNRFSNNGPSYRKHQPISKDFALFSPPSPKSAITTEDDRHNVNDDEDSPAAAGTTEMSNPLVQAKLNGCTNATSTRISSMVWMNETADPLLMVGSSDGNVRIWRDVLKPREDGRVVGARLVTAWTALPDLKGGSNGTTGLVLDFHQRSHQLLCAGGNTNKISIWDLSCELEVGFLELATNNSTTAITTYGQKLGLGGFAVDPEIDFGFGGFHAGGDNGNIFVVGLSDGGIRFFDKRIRLGGHPAANVAVCQNHRSWIIDIHVPQHENGRIVTSGSVSGEVKFWDIRRLSEGSTLLHQQLETYYEARETNAEIPRPRPKLLQPLSVLEAQRSPMTAIAFHEYAPIFATGSHHQFINYLNTDGEPLGSIRYHKGFFKQRIGPISTLTFHPYKMLLGAGTLDSLVSLYVPG